jgi:ABC-type multidrug transport system ATPase subunit
MWFATINPSAVVLAICQESFHCQDLTIAENLTFFTIFGTTLEENYDAIKEIYVQIEPFKDRRAGAPGGMKQKLALCCALIHKTKVLFLDEPTTGVDPVSEKSFGIKKIAKKGLRYWSPRPTWMLYVTGLH